MNWSKYALAALAVLVCMMATGVVVHGLLLHADYQALGPVMRSEADAQGHFLYMVLAHVSIALGIAWIYGKGVEAKPWIGQGLRFGLAYWLIGSVGVYLIYFAVQPLPAGLVTRQIAYGLIECLLMGLVVAAVYRK